MRVLRTLFAAGLAACALAMAPTASADSLMPGNARGKCLEMDRYGVVISRCDGSDAQDFRMSRGGRLETEYGCLAVDREGAPLVAARCGRDDRQSWDLSGGQLRNAGTGLCADVQGGRTQDGTSVQAYRCHGKSNQRWTLADSNGGGGYDDDYGSDSRGGVMLTPGHARGKCMDASDRSGNPLVIHDCHGRDNQRFSFNDRGRSTEIRVNGGCVTARSRVDRPFIVTSCDGSREQRFEFKRDGSIVSSTGECIDVLSGQTRNGTLIVPYTCSGTPSQTWSVRR